MTALTTFRVSFQAMGGNNEITVAAASAKQAQHAIDGAIGEVQRIEQKYSRYRADSWLSQFNAQAGTPGFVACDAETLKLLAIADALYEKSLGLFDITSGILRRAWNFRERVIPGTEQITALLPLIGWRHIERSAAGLRLPQIGMEIDLGGMAKEYAADCAAAHLRQQGLAHGYVNLGGDISVIGPQADGAPWRIGISHPRIPNRLLASIPLAQGALATSGDYERFFEHEGRRYCHILNPKTGWPCQHWQSMTVVAPTCLMAGAHTTIAMLLENQGLEWVQSTDYAYLAVDVQGCITSRASTTKATP